MSRTQRPTIGVVTGCQGGLVGTTEGWGLASHSAVSLFLSQHCSQPPVPDALSAGQDRAPPAQTRLCSSSLLLSEAFRKSVLLDDGGLALRRKAQFPPEQRVP